MESREEEGKRGRKSGNVRKKTMPIKNTDLDGGEGHGRQGRLQQDICKWLTKKLQSEKA